MDPVTHSEVPAATAPIAAPVVTVVIQTFNRGSILEYAIGSVLRQIFTDGELLVMGDARIDDSVAVVARCTNPRIRFVNLPERVADQSGPTRTDGCRLTPAMRTGVFDLPLHPLSERPGNSAAMGLP
jgi:hypothetical protein